MSVDAATIAFAHRLADEAGALIRPYFRRPVDVVNKLAGQGDFDPVTEADKGAERALRALIEAERPHDAILGEEYGEKPGSSGRRWVLDPVDGTRAFIAGRHEWGCLIALEQDGVPVLGLLDQPVLGERFIGVNAAAELHQGGTVTRLRTRPCARIADAILCLTDPRAYFTPAQQAAVQRLSGAARMTRYHGDCYLFAVLALGFVDCVVEAGLQPWDIAALVPLVQGAGGVITNWMGGPAGSDDTILAAGDARIHAAAMALLAN